MSTFVPVVLPILATMRSLRGRLGVNPYTVKLRIRTWTGTRPGIGTASDNDTLLVHTDVDGTRWPVQVTQVRREDTVASGSQYANLDLKVGPLAPDTPLEPAVAGSSQEIFWLVSGPDVPTNSVYKKISEEATSEHKLLWLRATGNQV